MKFLLAPLLLVMLAGCSTYHKVAVWYKYRNDFHLPKANEKQVASSPSLTTQGASKDTTVQLSTGVKSVIATTSRYDSAHIQSLISRRLEERDRSEIQVEKQEIPLSLRDHKRLYQLLQPTHTADGEPRKTHPASIAAGILGGLMLIAFWAAILLAISSKDGWDGLAWIAFGILAIILLTVPTLITSLIGLIKTSQNPERYKNRGIAIAALAISGFWALLFFVGIVYNLFN